MLRGWDAAKPDNAMSAFVKHKLTMAIFSYRNSLVNRRCRYREKNRRALKCDRCSHPGHGGKEICQKAGQQISALVPAVVS
jgi:hypothetical protein